MNAPTLRPNSAIAGMRCIRCEALYPAGDFFEGCPKCREAGHTASVAVEYGSFPSSIAADELDGWLAFEGGPLLGEGHTPLVRLETLAREIGIAGLWAKFEGANPTGSHKDRMSALVVQRAIAAGAETVVAASSGNAGVSLAAFSARAGLRCVIVTTAEMNETWRSAAGAHGAEIVVTATAEERWDLVAEKVRAGDWYPATNYLTPPVGSNPFGVDGLRAIAFEIARQSGDDAVSDIVVPTSRGDILWGIAKGFQDLQRAGLTTSLPRVHAVEPFPRISAVLSGSPSTGSFPGQSAMVSIGGSTVTYQALKALDMCGGTAVAVEEAAVLDDRRTLAAHGLFAEVSSAAALAGVRKLALENLIAKSSNAVIVITSHGYKDYNLRS
ncbi:threonine synthase [Bosea sp. (in: a-proteobacteria)]|jgi:threonine synthase|uniref:threonine synthase n=1 Tax=Bosea sp. (in: a-proteobacteria) TaxID=1871050 RepID=UPI003F717B6D